jgi:hypothetical protein
MSTDDDIDDQVETDREFTRRAEQLLTRLRNQGKAGGAAPDAQKDEDPPKDE